MIDCVTDGKTIQSKLALGAPILLHQCNNDRTLVVIVVIIRIFQCDSILRIQMKRSCDLITK